MKKLLIIFTLLFSVMFSSTSFAEWTKVSKNVSGDTFYGDYERVKKHNGYIYFWILIDFLKPNKYEFLSGKIYLQVDCKVFRMKGLNYVHHKQSMGRDIGDSDSPKNPEWIYPPPNSVYEGMLNKVCNH